MIAYIYGLLFLAVGLFVVGCFAAIYNENNGDRTPAPKICHWVFWIVIGPPSVLLILVMPMVVGTSLIADFS